MAEVRSNRLRIEAALSLGADSSTAAAPYLNTSVRAALIPTIDHLKNLGVIFIPGAMTGLLIAGADPVWAAEWQIAIFFMILSSGVIATTMVTGLARRQLFTSAHQLEVPPRQG